MLTLSPAPLHRLESSLATFIHSTLYKSDHCRRWHIVLLTTALTSFGIRHSAWHSAFQLVLHVSLALACEATPHSVLSLVSTMYHTQAAKR